MPSAGNEGSGNAADSTENPKKMCPPPYPTHIPKPMKRIFSLFLFLVVTFYAQAEDKIYYGYCPQTLSSEHLSAVGTGESGLMQVAICLDPATDPAVARLKGQRILGVRLFARTAYTSSQRASDRYVFHAENEIDGATMSKTTCKFYEGWNEVLFQTPAVIGDAPLYLGASVYETMGTPYPFGVYNGAEAPNSYFLNVQKEGWKTRSGSVLLLEAIVEDLDPAVKAPDGLLSGTAHVSFKGNDLTVRPSALMNGKLYVHNQSAQSVKALAFKSEDAAGETHIHHLDLSDNPLAPFDARIIDYKVMSPSLNGTAQPLTLNVTELTPTEGESLDAQGRGVSFTTSFLVMDDAFRRIPLVEEFTSQYCINCPFMVYYLDQAMEEWRSQGNPLLYVAHHSGFQADMFTQEADRGLLFLFGKETSYNPAVMYDRRVFAGYNSPVMGAKVAETTPYTEAITAVSQVPALAEVHVNLNEGRKAVTVSGTVNRDIVAEGMPIHLTCYLVESGIPTTTFFQKGLTEFEDAPDDLAEKFRHNGVIRHAFTEPTGEVITTVNDGNACTFSVTYDLPEKVSPLPVLDKKNCDIVAFLHFVSEDDMYNNFLLNAGSLRYTDESLGITAPTVTPASPVCYDLQGRRIGNGVRQHGICIDSNGRKIVR